jgi:hypothetical protein
VERIIYHGRDLTPLASVLAQLAFALDEHGSPIDYARRRALFTGPQSVTLDLDAYARMRLQHGLSAGYAPREAVLRWYLLVLLSGEHPAIPGAKKPFGWHCTTFRFSAPRPLRVFLRQQAEVSLARYDIAEPVTWEPPSHWVTWPDWPGTDPARIPGEKVTALLEAGSTVHDIATAVGLTAEHVRLWCEISGTGALAAAAHGIPVSQSRAGVLAPARLRDLYEYQNLPVAQIAAMAGCATATIRRLLQLDGVPQRPSYRRPSPASGITRDWLQREYVVKLRSVETLARERGVTAYYLMSLARNWGLPIRQHSQFSGIGHLNLPALPSPAMRAVAMRKGALGRLELITRIPGHDNIAAAARVLYDGRASALAQMLHKIETAAGFAIIDRSGRPLAPTTAGREFIYEASQILRIAQEQGDRPDCPPADSPNRHRISFPLRPSSRRIAARVDDAGTPSQRRRPRSDLVELQDHAAEGRVAGQVHRGVLGAALADLGTERGLQRSHVVPVQHDDHVTRLADHDGRLMTARETAQARVLLRQWDVDIVVVPFERLDVGGRVVHHDESRHLLSGRVHGCGHLFQLLSREPVCGVTGSVLGGCLRAAGPVCRRWPWLPGPRVPSARRPAHRWWAGRGRGPRPRGARTSHP